LQTKWDGDEHFAWNVISVIAGIITGFIVVELATLQAVCEKGPVNLMHKLSHILLTRGMIPVHSLMLLLRTARDRR
jgi:hypothetical protein